MKAVSAIVVVAAFGLGWAAVAWWPQTPRPAARAPGGERDDPARTVESIVGSGPVAPADASNDAGAPRDRASPAVGADVRGSAAARETAPTRADAQPVWPASPDARVVGRGGVTPTGEPAVPAKLAFRALNFVGVDPEAEKTWMRAINDPNLPAGVRSDLIEDLNDEGYSDNSNPSAKDLPLILARLELIERLAPYAMDQVNADAFEEAYKDLLNMYVRLGGQPRGN